MKRVAFGLVMVFAGLLSAVEYEYPNGITISVKEYESKTDKGIMDEICRIYFENINNCAKEEAEETRCYGVIEEDITGDGKKDFLLKTFTPHEGFKVYAVPIVDDADGFVVLDQGSVEFDWLEDPDEDGVLEFVTWTGEFSRLFGELESGDIKVAYRLDPKKRRFVIDVNATKKLDQTREPTIADKLNGGRPPQAKFYTIYFDEKWSHLSVKPIKGLGDAFVEFVVALYTGDKEGMYRFIQKRLRFDHPATKFLFFQDMALSILYSPVADDLLEIHGWSESLERKIPIPCIEPKKRCAYEEAYWLANMMYQEFYEFEHSGKSDEDSLHK